MGVEIERKFLVAADFPADWENCVTISQAYLASQISSSVRIRIESQHGIRTNTLCVKVFRTSMSNDEVEIYLDNTQADELVAVAGSPVSKHRHFVERADGLVWEVDVFRGLNSGLIVAEIEVPYEDYDIGKLPSWVGDEVTHDGRYKNASLAEKPFMLW